MNNEPVAWMDYLEHSDVYDLNVSGRGIPLYTHPVKELTKEPICWAMIRNGDFYDAIHPLEHLGEEGSYTVPLYDHPVKELTDEEIIAVGNAVVNLIDSNEGWLEFARAILRKAQEK